MNADGDTDSGDLADEGRARELLLARIEELERQNVALVQRAADERRRLAEAHRRIQAMGRAGHAWMLVRRTVRRPWRAYRFPGELMRIFRGLVPEPPSRPATVETPDVAAARRAAGAREESARRRTAIVAAERGRPARPSAGLRVAAIGDPWLLDALAPVCQLVPLTPADWRMTLERIVPDILLVQTAWDGPSGVWQYRLAWHPFHESLRLDAVRQISTWCLDRGVPRVLWDTEPLDRWPRFKALAGLVDHVAAADADAADAYRSLPTSTAASVSVVPVGIGPPPAFPAPVETLPIPLFVGEGRTDLPLDRREALDRMLAAGALAGAAVCDLAGTTEPERYRLTADACDRRIAPTADRRIRETVARYAVALLDGGGPRPGAAVPRLALEALAAGTPVVTTHSPALVALLGDLVMEGDTVAELSAAIEAARSPIHRERIRAAVDMLHAEHGIQRRLARITGSVGLNVDWEAAG